MRELLIVLADFYILDESERVPASSETRLVGLSTAVRYGVKTKVPQGWRPWLASWLGQHELANAAAGTVASAAATPRSATAGATNTQARASTKAVAATSASSAAHLDSRVAPVARGSAREVRAGAVPTLADKAQGVAGSAPLSDTSAPDARGDRDAAGFVWIAQPVHLITGLRSVHLDHAGLLHLTADTQQRLVESFTVEFASSPFRLEALPGGSFLLGGPAAPGVQTSDPARYLGSSIHGATPTGVDAAIVQRLVAEMEMWLHEHPVNRARAQVRQRSISTLWLWGGGISLTSESARISRTEVTQVLLGDDPYLDGLIALGVADRASNASTVGADFSQITSVNADKVAAIVEAYRLPENSPIATPIQAVEDVDRRWIAPAIQSLGQGGLDKVHIVANDRCITMRSKDRVKFWRRRRDALASLQ